MTNIKRDNSSEININRLIHDLKAIGVGPGDHLGLGISLKKIGRVTGGPNVLIDSLLEVVGAEGTLMIPAYTKNFHLSLLKGNRVNYVFDHLQTPVATGIVPETLRKRPDALRSRHPTNSVAAIGRYSDFLTKGHDERAPAYSPYSKLGQINGKILCIGIGDKLVGIRHQAQYSAGLLGIVPYRCGTYFRGQDGSKKLFIRKDKGGCVTTLPSLVTDLREKGFVRDGKIGHAESILVPAREALCNMTRRLKDNPTLNLCDDLFCLWCRELERRMKLYSLPGAFPKYQNNPFVRISLILINRIRLNHPQTLISMKLAIKSFAKKGNKTKA